MKRLILITLLSVFLFSTTAQAKIVFNGRAMQDVHLNTIKGFLYEVYEQTNVVVKREVGIRFARTIQWLETTHKSKSAYTLSSKSKDPSAQLVLSAMNQITQVLSEHKNFGDVLLKKWFLVGRQVQSNYKEVKGKIVWKLVLHTPSKEKKGKNKSENNKK